jgi:SAM-dependent methyltransferase
MDRLVFERMNQQEAVHWWFVARRDMIRTTIERLIKLPAGADILEAGCGTGGNIDMLMRLGHLDAFEFDTEARVIAAAKSGSEVPFGALPDDIPFAGKTYDLIGLFDVLEHIEDDHATLANLGARLKPGGRILVTVPALPWLWSQHDVRHHHFRRYTRATLAKVATKAGLRVERSFYFNSFLLPVAVGLRAAKALTRSAAPDDTLPGPLLNRALRRVFASERHLIGRLRLPIGLSVCAILARGATNP